MEKAEKGKSGAVVTAILGVVAVLAAAAAVYMLAAPNAPRAGAVSGDAEPVIDETLPMLTIYEGPQTMSSSETAKVWAQGYELFVYDVMVNHERTWNANTIPSNTPMTYFDFEGEVEIEVEMPGLPRAVENAVVMPSSYGITPAVEDGRVSFAISQPGQYTVVYNGDVNKATHIFANPLETDIPDKNDPSVFFVEPGEWKMDAIQLLSDQTLYISGGAVLHSVIIVDNSANVTIRGRGIIDNSEFPAHNQPGSYARVPIDVRNAKNVTAEGFIIANGNAWTFNSYSTEGLTVDNVKIISGRQNGDGFTFQSCRDHTVRNSFARTWDDSLVLKNYSGATRNILFENVQVWTDLAQSMEIGYETNKGLNLKPEITDVTFKDITVLYNWHKPVISIHNSDDAMIDNVRYENIVVENAFMHGDNGANNELIEMNLNKSGWSMVRDEYGSVSNVVIDGLTVINTLDGRAPQSRIYGHSDEHTISNVTIRNVTILGERVTDLKGLNMDTNEFVVNISIE